jgi:hypothetical protein
MQNLTVHPGGPSPFLLGPAHACPSNRTPAPLTGQTRLSAAPPPGTVLAHPSHASLPSLFPRERRTWVAVGRRPSVRARPQGTPCAVWHPTPGPPPPLSPFFPSLPRRRPAVQNAHERRPLERRQLLCHPLLSGPPLERPTLPTASRARTAASGHRKPLLRADSDRAPPSSATPR